MNPWRYLLLLAGVCALGLSAPAVRYAAAAPLAIVAWRLLLSSPVFAAASLLRGERWPVRSALLGAGFFTAYLVLWVTSIQKTTVTGATLLVSTGPLWSALLSWPVLGERIARRQWGGLLLALAGTAIVVVGPTGSGRPRALWGDLCAFGASWAWVGYTFVGRRARRTAGFAGYTAALYATSALIVVVLAVWQRIPLLGFSPTTWAALVVLAVLPTLLGHGSFNYLLRFLDPTRLSLWLLGKPLIAAALAWALFGERPSIAVLAGGAAVLSGIGIAIAAPAGDERLRPRAGPLAAAPRSTLQARTCGVPAAAATTPPGRVA